MVNLNRIVLRYGILILWTQDLCQVLVEVGDGDNDTGLMYLMMMSVSLIFFKFEVSRYWFWLDVFVGDNRCWPKMVVAGGWTVVGL